MRENYTLTRLYIDASLFVGADINVPKEQVHYLVNVLRKHTGDHVRVVNGRDGEWRGEIIEAGGFTASGRISAFSGDPEKLVENAYLACLTRRPTAEESEHFAKQFAEANEKQRPRIVEDLYWILFNSPEFAWNH
mgnify:CR=1 FL=1